MGRQAQAFSMGMLLDFRETLELLFSTPWLSENEIVNS
jgi:hypothetical protein